MARPVRGIRITLAQVAEAAGVAESTASRILNGYTKQFRVRPEVKQRVLEAAEQMGYRPNPIVRSIAAKRTNLIAVVGWAQHGLDECCISAAVDVLSRAGKFVGTSFLSAFPRGHELPPWRADGAVLIDAHEPEDIENLELSGMPYVSLGGSCGPGGDSVAADGVAAVRDLVNHLVSLGHRTISPIAGPSEVFGWNGHAAAVPEFLDAVRAATADAGVRMVPAFDGTADRLDATVERLVRSSSEADRATAVICRNDVVGCLVLQAAMRVSVCIPADLSVAAVNDGIAARLTCRRLTSVEFPAMALGQQAAELLLARMDAVEPPASQSVALAGTLVVGESTLAPRASL